MSDGSTVDDLPVVTDAEMFAQHGGPLPAKTAMTTINVSFGFPINNLAMPINLAMAINDASPESWAIADADQIVVLQQVDQAGPGH